MYTFTTVLIILTSIIMVLIVLVQNSKGGGLSSTFGGGSQMGGVVQTNKFLEKTTWVLAIALLFLSITASMSIPRPDSERESATQKFQNELNTTSVPQMMTPEQVNEMNKKDKKDK